MDIPPIFQTLGISLGLGLLVGLQREHVAKHIAGIRTFPLITVTGTIAAMLAGLYGGWVLAAALAGVIAILVLGVAVEIRRGEAEVGITTEIAVLAMFLVGAMLVDGPRSAAVAVGAGVAVLLQLKAPMHRFVQRVGERDIRAVMQFALITLVILPVLPDEEYGPYRVLNPSNIWLMVVLVSGIGFAGYLMHKAFGDRAGTVAAGLIGGAISSTAATVSFSQRAGKTREAAVGAVVAIMLATVVSFIRVFIEIAVVSPTLLGRAWLPLTLMIVAGICVSIVLWLTARDGDTGVKDPDNPFELRPALVFGALYAIIILAVAAGDDLLGNSGVYAVAALSGVVDMDAITLSTSRLVEREGTIDADTGWRVVFVALSSNLVFKTALAAALGGRSLGVRVALANAALLALALGLLIFY